MNSEQKCCPTCKGTDTARSYDSNHKGYWWCVICQLWEPRNPITSEQKVGEFAAETVNDTDSEYEIAKATIAENHSKSDIEQDGKLFSREELENTITTIFSGYLSRADVVIEKYDEEAAIEVVSALIKSGAIKVKE